MTVTILAEIGGEVVPLADCDWVLWGPCGCPQGITVGALPGSEIVHASEEQAWAALYGSEDEIAEAKQRGERMELMTRERAGAEVLPSCGEPCPHVKTGSEDKGENP